MALGEFAPVVSKEVSKKMPTLEANFPPRFGDRSIRDPLKAPVKKDRQTGHAFGR